MHHHISRFPDLSFLLLSRLPKLSLVASAISSAITVAGAVSDFHRFPYYLENIQALMDVLYEFSFNFFQQVSKHPLKEVKASGGCHKIGKEFFVQAQSRFRTQLCCGIIDCDKTVSIIAYFFKISIFLSKFVTFSLIFFRKM